MDEEQKQEEGEVTFEGETITISLEDATKIIMEQQGIDGGVLPPGTYTILTQDGLQIATDGLPISEGELNASVGITVVPNNVTGYGEQVVSSILVEKDGDQMVLENSDLSMADQSDTAESCDGEQIMKIDPQQENAEKLSEDDSNHTQCIIRVGDEELKGQSSVNTVLVKDVTSLIPSQESNEEENTNVKNISLESGESVVQNESNVVTEKSTESQKDSVEEKSSAASNVKPAKQLDLSKPIEVTNETEVIINGKKCILRANPQTGQLCAYPVLGKKKRGRPPKSFREIEIKQENYSPNPEKRKDPVLLEKYMEQTNAAEGLLELSNTGPDGVRRSGRTRKKAKTLDDYEILEVSSDDEIKKEVENDDEEEIVLLGVKKRKVDTDLKEYIPTNAYTTPVSGVKRGRGRPRRYPPAGQTSNPTQIPAVIIPSANGQTLMMAPIQGLSNFQAFQQQIKSLPQIVTKIPVVTNVTLAQSSTITNVSNSNTVISETNSDLVSDSVSCTVTTKSDQDDGGEISASQALTVTGTMLENVSSTDSPPSVTIDTEEPLVEENQNSGETQEMTESSEIAAEDQEGQNSVTDGAISETGSSTGDVISTTTVSKVEDGVDNSDQQTIIQIPEKLLPMFLPKKDPIKLGLKFSDKELNDLKCPKCGYQAFYPQQYQTHIATHTEETQKCKCCNFVSFNKENLLAHFKENHPRCICNVCDFMAEHAYVIKRHMMRHNANGCTCDICGRVYKDQYILKMHVRMVHMPAEVLYECTVCSKKFTRKAHLKRHLRIHEPEKPFKCPHCDYRGCERSDISKHILIHEEPKHVCEVCGKAFRHLKNKELHLKRHNGQKDYKCGVCDVYGYTFTDIRKHIERKHSDIKTCVCDKCGAALKSPALLREHQKESCEVYMIEQALAIATSSGGTSHATIQIPSSTLAIDGDHLPLGNSGQVNITVEQISMPGTVSVGEDSITLTEEQLQESLQEGSLTISDAQVIEAVSDDHITEQGEIMTQGHVEVMAQGQIIDDATGQDVIDGVDQVHIIEHGQIHEASIEEGEVQPMIHVVTSEGTLQGVEEESLAIALTE